MIVYCILLSSLAMFYMMAQVVFSDCSIFDQLQVRSLCIVGGFMIYRWSRWSMFVSLVVSMFVSLVVSMFVSLVVSILLSVVVSVGVSLVRSASGQL